MALFDPVRRFLTSTKTLSSAELGSMYTMTSQHDGPRRGAAELIKMYDESPAFRSVVSKIAESVAGTDWQLFFKSGANGRAVRAGAAWRKGGYAVRRNFRHRARKSGNLVEVEDHPFLDFVYRASSVLDYYASMYLSELFLDIKGEVFWVVDRDGLGLPYSYQVIPPHWVTRMPGKGRDSYDIEFKDLTMVVPADDVICFKSPSPYNPYGRGSGVGDSLSDMVDTSEFAERMVKSFFYNRAKPDLMVGVETSSGQKVDESILLRMKDTWERQNRGIGRANRTHFHSGKITVHEFQRNFKDMQLVELESHHRDAIRMTLGVPPEILGDVKNSNRATIRAAETIMARQVTIPRLERILPNLQKVAEEFDPRLLVDYVSPVPDDEEFRLEAMRANPRSLTKNEWREVQGFEPVDDGDEFETPAPAILPPELGAEEDRAARPFSEKTSQIPLWKGY